MIGNPWLPFYGREDAVESLQEGVCGFPIPIGEDTLKVTLDHACAGNHLCKHQTGILFGHSAHPATPRHKSLLRQELVSSLIDFCEIQAHLVSSRRRQIFLLQTPEFDLLLIGEVLGIFEPDPTALL